MPFAIALIVALGMVGLVSGWGYRPTLSAWRGADVAALAGLGIASVGFAWQNLRKARRMAASSSSPAAGFLITEGVFSSTRNPVSLGCFFLLASLARFLGTWALLGPVAYAVLVYWVHIRPEERRLAERYGSAYLAYKQRVRRWV